MWNQKKTAVLYKTLYSNTKIVEHIHQRLFIILDGQEQGANFSFI